MCVQVKMNKAGFLCTRLLGWDIDIISISRSITLNPRTSLNVEKKILEKEKSKEC